MVVLTARQKLHLGINTTFLGAPEFLQLLEYFITFHLYYFLRINRKLKN
jgi:hypothetical protein